MSFWNFERPLPVPRRIKRLVVFLQIAPLLCFFYMIFSFANGGAEPFSAWWVITPTFLLYLPSIIILRRLLHRVRQVKMKACTHCAASILESNASECACCGTPYDATEAQRLWRSAILRYANKGRKPALRALRFRALYFIACVGIAAFVLLIPVGLFSTDWILQNNKIAPWILMLYLTAGLGGHLLSLAAFVAIAIRTRTKLDLARNHSFLVCDRCLYPLEDLADSVACPECGATHDTHDLRRRWYECWGTRKRLREAIEMDIPLAIREDSSP